MSVRTLISKGGDEGVRIRGYKLVDLMEGSSFAAAVHLLLMGELPGRAEARLLDAILVSAVDHGINAPSIHIARAQASCGVPLSTAVAAGVASIGTHHGGAGEACARILQEALAARSDPAGQGIGDTAKKIAEEHLSAVKNIPGFGHRVYKTSDPRTDALLGLAKDLGLLGDHCRLALGIVDEIERIKGRRLVLNVDGAQAAILSDMGYRWPKVACLFVIGRTAGLCAHVAEELESGRPLGYLKETAAEEDYQGSPDRSLCGEGRASTGTKA
jgi:citryl-CoA lyase